MPFPFSHSCMIQLREEEESCFLTLKCMFENKET